MTAMEWQPIETAPRGEPVLVCWAECLDFKGTIEVACLNEWIDPKTSIVDEILWDGLGDDHPYWNHGDPTHWHPLPDPPE